MVATLEINALFKGGTKQLKKGSQKTGSQASKAGSQAKKLGSQAKKSTPKNFPIGPAGGAKRGPGGRYQNGEGRDSLLSWCRPGPCLSQLEG